MKFENENNLKELMENNAKQLRNLLSLTRKTKTRKFVSPMVQAVENTKSIVNNESVYNFLQNNTPVVDMNALPRIEKYVNTSNVSVSSLIEYQRELIEIMTYLHNTIYVKL